MTSLTIEQRPEGWNPVADAYDDVFAPFSSRFAADVLRLCAVGEGDRVLDVAAGTGALSLAAARRGAQVLATDFSPGMLARLADNAQHAGLDLRVEVQDGQALNVPSDAFDAAFSVLGLIFFPDRAAGFAGLYGALRPGGRAGVVCWSTLERLPLMQAILGPLRRALPELPAPAGPPPWLALSDRERLQAEMRAAGFADVNVFTVSHVLEFEDPGVLSERLQGISPALEFLFGSLSTEQRVAFREAFTGSICAGQGNGPYGLEAEAHIAIGTK